MHLVYNKQQYLTVAEGKHGLVPRWHEIKQAASNLTNIFLKVKQTYSSLIILLTEDSLEFFLLLLILKWTFCCFSSTKWISLMMMMMMLLEWKARNKTFINYLVGREQVKTDLYNKNIPDNSCFGNALELNSNDKVTDWYY